MDLDEEHRPVTGPGSRSGSYLADAAPAVLAPGAPTSAENVHCHEISTWNSKQCLAPSHCVAVPFSNPFALGPCEAISV